MTQSKSAPLSHRRAALDCSDVRSDRRWPGPTTGRSCIDFVRHGESIDNARGHHRHDPTRNGTRHHRRSGQADSVAYRNPARIRDQHRRSLRLVGAQDRADGAPLLRCADCASATGHHGRHDVDGLDEIPAGAFEGDPTTSLEGILYLLGPLSWRWAMYWSRMSATPA